jgi:hypothetical protein
MEQYLEIPWIGGKQSSAIDLKTTRLGGDSISVNTKILLNEIRVPLITSIHIHIQLGLLTCVFV